MAACPKVVPLSKGSTLFREMYDQFHEQWQPGLWGSSQASIPPPRIGAIYSLSFDHRDDFHTMRGGVGNEQRHFHGTRISCSFRGAPCDDLRCNACGIVKHGRLLMSKAGSEHACRFGKALYLTSKSSVAKGYGGKHKGGSNTGFHAEDDGNAMFICSVLCGNVQCETNIPCGVNPAPDPKHSTLASGFDSKIMVKTTGNDEVVIYREEQVLPIALICFDKHGS